MDDINTLSAIAQERARIREELLQLPWQSMLTNEPYIRREDVLKIIRNDPDHGTA